MSDTLRMEAERIRTLRTVYLLGLLAVVLGGIATAFLAATAERGALTPEATKTVLTGGSYTSVVPFVGLPVMFIGVAVVLEDTRYKLATVLLVAQPRRSTLMVARMLVLTAIALPVGAGQMVVSTITALALGRTPQLTEIPQVIVPYLASLVLYSWVGAALGWITGTAAAPVGVALLDVLLLEPLTKVAGTEYSDTLEDWAERLPFTAARDALSLDAEAVVVAVFYAAVLIVAAWMAVRARDY
jgi:ABC-2 type transport system permease protein